MFHFIGRSRWKGKKSLQERNGSSNLHFADWSLSEKLLHFDENSQEEEKAYATFLFEQGTLFALKCSEKAQVIEICLRTCTFLE